MEKAGLVTSNQIPEHLRTIKIQVSRAISEIARCEDSFLFLTGKMWLEKIRLHPITPSSVRVSSAGTRQVIALSD